MEKRPNQLWKLETQRLLLNSFKKEDVSKVVKLAGDFDVYDMTLNIPHPYTLDDATDWISGHQVQFEEQSNLIYAIRSKMDNLLLGCINLSINKKHESGEFGYWIGKTHWGNGYCSEAVSKLIDVGFRNLGLNKIHASHISRNPASGRVMIKNGMQHEGTLKHHLKKEKRFESLELYGILKADYKFE